MNDQPLEHKKPGPKPKKNPEIEALKERIDRLERCIGKMAHYNGGNNGKICKEFAIPQWTPERKDMTRLG